MNLFKDCKYDFILDKSNILTPSLSLLCSTSAVEFVLQETRELTLAADNSVPFPTDLVATKHIVLALPGFLDNAAGVNLGKMRP